MAKYIVTGGTPLHGTVTLSGAKNSGFKLMIAALLADSPSQISNIGMISEIDLAKDNISSLGGSVSESGDHCLEVNPTGLKSFEISKENGEKSRSSSMYIPAILHRFGKTVVPMPGGDKIGKRPLDRHFDGLKQMGVEIRQEDNICHFSLKPGQTKLQGTTYRFDKNTHTGTETLLMAAVKAQGTTVLENAALEPEIDNMIEFLTKMGGDIKREGRKIIIKGVDHLKGAEIESLPDRNEAVSFGCMALGTQGDIVINKVRPEHLTAFIDQVRLIGGGLEVQGESIRIFYKGNLSGTNVVVTPHPGFMTDWQAVWTALMTQAQGESVVHETVFDSRFAYVPLLQKMGAKIELFNPKVENPEEFYNFNLADDKPTNFHAAKIFGPTPLAGAQVEIRDLRAGATLMMAGMMAKGQTTIDDPLDQIKRGYEDLPGKLKSLGAKIETVN